MQRRTPLEIFLKAISIITVTAALLAPLSARAQAPSPIVEVPLTVDYVTLGEALKRQIYAQNERAMLWSGSNECEYLYAEHPVFSRAGDRMKLESDGHLSIGVPMGAQCLSPISWSGIIQAETAPYVLGHMLKLRVTDINLLNPQHQKTLIVGRGFDLVKRYFIPRVETFEFDLDPVTDQLKNLAEAASPPEVAERVKTTLGSLRVEPQVVATDDGIRATIEMTLPSFPTATAAPPIPQLTAAELAAFEKQLDQWDAFLVFSIKQLGGIDTDRQFRSDLLSILLDSRHRLVEALAHPETGGPDPVRLLFLDEWKRLGDSIRDAALRGKLGNRSLEFLSFISAGDALFALDQAAPALGMRISAGDLRRLAHIMAPKAKGDPLAFSFDEDPELQKMFGVKAPLESAGPFVAGPTEAPPEAIASPGPTSSPTPSASATPAAAPPPFLATPAPTSAVPAASPAPTAMRSPGSATASPTPSPGLSPPTGPATSPRPVVAVPTPAGSARVGATSTTFELLWPFGAAQAYAAQPMSMRIGDVTRKLQELGQRLKRAVVNTDNAGRYRAEMDQLLELGGVREMNEEEVDASYRPVYAKLVKAVAWQESCWRQFRIKRNRVVFLESSSHDVGLMQVNRYVWRGFYSVPRLEWDVLYNASAGMDILAQTLDNVGDRPGAMTRGKPDELARSVYAAYNGGPSAYRRWRGRESREERLIDGLFSKKYQAVLRGQGIDILTCAAEWEKTPGH